MDSSKDTSQEANGGQSRSTANNVSADAISLPAVKAMEQNEDENEAPVVQQKADGHVARSFVPQLPPAKPVTTQPGAPLQFRHTGKSASPSINTTPAFSPVQLQENKTGMPDTLKSGIENLSGQAMDDVKVHYNSAEPKQFHAHAYAQGTDIHIGPGQEKHLPHEAWHVVQQKQGRVQPTTVQRVGEVDDDFVASLNARPAGMEAPAKVTGREAPKPQAPKGDSYEDLIAGLQSKPMDLAPDAAPEELSKEDKADAATQSKIDAMPVPRFGDPEKHGGLFGSDEYQEQWRPGMAMLGGAKAAGEKGLKGMEGATKAGISGAGKALSATGSALKKSGALMNAPRAWAAKGMKNTNSKGKKALYAAGGALGSLLSVPAGLVAGGVSAGVGLAAAGTSVAAGLGGAALAGAAGLTGAAVGGALGGTAMLGGGVYKGGKAIKKAVKGNVNKELLGVYKPGATHDKLGDRASSEPGAQVDDEKFNPDGTRKNYGAITAKEGANYGLLGGGGVAAVTAGALDNSNKIMDSKNAADFFTKGGIAQNNFEASHISSGGQAFGALGVAGGALGTGAALMDAYGAGKVAANKSSSKQTTALASGQALSSLADATKASATGAYNLASILDSQGVAAGATIAAGGAAVAMGAIDMIRGGYGVFTARERIKLLKSIQEKSKDNPEIVNMAAEAIATQNRAKETGKGQILKGGLAIAGGLMLLAVTMTTPMGWMILGVGAVVGIGMAIRNWYTKRAQKKIVVARELGVTPDAMKAHEDQVEAIKKKPGHGALTKKRKEALAALGKNPYEKKLAEHGFTSTGHCYTNYINASANKLYTEGVLNEPLPGEAKSPYEDVITSIGLNVKRPHKTDKKTWTPGPEQIAKALGG